MRVIPPTPKNAVTSRTTDINALVQMALGGPQPPWPSYEFGGGLKKFMSNLQGGGIYDKPVLFEDGVTTHLTDPDNISQNP